MNSCSEDLRRKITSALEGGMPKAQAAHVFRVSLSSVKLYAGKAARGELLAHKRSPGTIPKLDGKAMRLLAEDLREGPSASLQDRCDWVRIMTGLSVTRSTACNGTARSG